MVLLQHCGGIDGCCGIDGCGIDGCGIDLDGGGCIDLGGIDLWALILH